MTTATLAIDTPSAVHEVSTGPSTTQKWMTKLKLSTTGGSYPLSKMFGLILGKQNAGKTNLCSSHPNGLILSLDCSGTVHPSPTTPQWPQVDSASGDVLDWTGPMSLRWGDVLRMVDELVGMAKRGEPRPDTIFVDTLTRAISLVKDWLYDEKKLVAAGVAKTFYDYEGQNKWGALDNQIFNNFIYRLRQAGYGVWALVHLTDNWKGAIEDDARPKRTKEWRMDLADGMLRRLSTEAEMAMTCIRLEEPKTETVIVAGKPVTTQTTSTRHLVKFIDSRLLTNRVRVAHPSRIVGEKDVTGVLDSWPQIEAWYQSARI